MAFHTNTQWIENICNLVHFILSLTLSIICFTITFLSGFIYYLAINPVRLIWIFNLHLFHAARFMLLDCNTWYYFTFLLVQALSLLISVIIFFVPLPKCWVTQSSRLNYRRVGVRVYFQLTLPKDADSLVHTSFWFTSPHKTSPLVTLNFGSFHWIFLDQSAISDLRFWTLRHQRNFWQSLDECYTQNCSLALPFLVYGLLEVSVLVLPKDAEIGFLNQISKNSQWGSFLFLCSCDTNFT
jgi:hypothetical protein